MRDMVKVPKTGSGNRYEAPKMRLSRSQFSKRHKHVTTFDASRLVPIFVREVLPGETHTMNMNAIIRIFSPLDAPIFDNIEATIDWFYVPNRLVWSNFKAFLGEHDSAGAQDVEFTVPILSGATAVEASSLAHYMGIPIGLSFGTTDVQALPFRGYLKIYNEWYRDQNVIDQVGFSLGDGPDSADYGDESDNLVYRSAKKADYFTTALPYLQKGDPVTVPLVSSNAPVIPSGSPARPTLIGEIGNEEVWLEADEANTDPIVRLGQAGSTSFAVGEDLYWEDPALEADLSGVSAISINALREAAAIQRMLERDARGGTRYPELIRSHFGVDIGDGRVQRSEYIGGSKGNIQIAPVANTSATATEDQGQLTGVGAGSLSGRWAQSFTEHGFIYGILRARGELGYHQGLDRMWSRSTKYDFYWPELANLGEQPIYNRELWIAGDATDDNVFGYQERFGEYRFAKSLITGKFDPAAAGSLDFWHLAEDFGSQPVLNQTFVQDATPMARVTTVDTEPDFIIYAEFDWRVASPMPVRPIPSLVPPRF